MRRSTGRINFPDHVDDDDDDDEGEEERRKERENQISRAGRPAADLNVATKVVVVVGVFFVEPRVRTLWMGRQREPDRFDVRAEEED